MTQKSRLPKGCYHDRALVRTIFLALVQGSVSSQKFDWILLLLVSVDFWKLWFSCPYFTFTENPTGVSFGKYHYEVGVSEDIYVMYIYWTYILFSRYQGDEEPCFSPSSPNCTLSCSPHSSWMVDEPLGSQKELHSWKMMKIVFIFHSHHSHQQIATTFITLNLLVRRLSPHWGFTVLDAVQTLNVCIPSMQRTRKSLHPCLKHLPVPKAPSPLPVCISC